VIFGGPEDLQHILGVWKARNLAEASGLISHKRTSGSSSLSPPCWAFRCHDIPVNPSTYGGLMSLAASKAVGQWV
jgi:hypothetical protein